MSVTVTQTGDKDEPLEWWMRATEIPNKEKPKRNYLIGFPEGRARDLIPTLATRYRGEQRAASISSTSSR